MMMRKLLLGAPLIGSCFIVVGGLGPTPCEEGAAPRCEENVLVTCEAGIESRVQCGGFACDAELARCGACGDNFVDSLNGELCDDGNNENGDGCRDDCGGLEVCGDGFTDVNEGCDDGNVFSGDGCAGDCLSLEECGNEFINVTDVFSLPADTIESLRFEYLVTGCGVNQESLTFRVNSITILSPPTNNACDCVPGIESFTVTDPTILDTLNDDNNVIEVESNSPGGVILSWALVVAISSQDSADMIVADISGLSAAVRQPDLCVSNGNTSSPFEFSVVTQGITEFTQEGCDDGNTTAGDGCDAICARESGFICNGEPSDCFDVCGDGFVDPAALETCDDANNVDNDACPNDCSIP